MKFSWREIVDKFFWRAVFAEFFGTTLFLYLVTSILTSIQIRSLVAISLGIGLSISVLAQIFGPVCGAHFNPAVTIGVLIQQRISIIRAIFYTLAQLIGAIVGSALTYLATPKILKGSLVLKHDVTEAQAFFVEFMLTMLLVLVVLSSISSDNRRQDLGYANSLAIGISIVVIHIAGIPYSGASVNPARAFGPSVVFDFWPQHHWVYWVGPYFGGIVAGVIYRFILGVNEPQTTITITQTPVKRNERHSLILEAPKF